MRKKIFAFLLGFLLVPSLVFGYTIQSGDTLSSIARQFNTSVGQLVVDNNISNPDLIYAGDNLIVDEPTLGYSVATGYEKNLRTSMNATQTYVPVTSLALKDGTTLSMTDLGSKVFLTIEPGTSREEIVLCTDIDTSAINFTGCTRGLAFSGTSESAVTANRKAHGAGSKVIMSNVHYVYDQLADLDTAQTISAPYTFTSSSPNIYYTFPVVSSTGYTGLPTNNGELTTWYAAQTLVAGGFSELNVSSTLGLLTTGDVPEQVGINASSTTGMTFDSNGALYQKTQSATGIESDSDGIKINTSTLIGLIATSTPTANSIPIVDSNGDLDTEWINDGGLSTQWYTAGEAIDASSGPIAVYLDTDDGKIYKTDSGVATTTFTFIGFVQSGQNVSTDETALVQTSGLVYNFSGLSTSTPTYYISTSGAISNSAGTIKYKIGRTVGTTSLLIEKGRKILTGSISYNNGSNNSGSSTNTITTGFYPSKITVIGGHDPNGAVDANIGYALPTGYWQAGTMRGWIYNASTPTSYSKTSSYLVRFYSSATSYGGVRTGTVSATSTELIIESYDGNGGGTVISSYYYIIEE